LPAAGTYGKEKLGRLFNAMLGQLKNGLKMTLKGAIAEGDKLALEAESYGELKNGRVYNQHYSFVIEFRDGKICGARVPGYPARAPGVVREGVKFTGTARIRISAPRPSRPSPALRAPDEIRSAGSGP
jgi:hypothetical protein